jgi:hypothetical protein
VKDLALRGTGNLVMRGQTLPVVVEEYVVPGKASRQDVTIGTNKVVQLFVDGKAFLKEGGKVVELPAKAAASMQRGLFRDPNFVLLHASEKGVRVRARPPLNDGGVVYDVLEVIAPDGDATRLVLDPKTHLITRMMYRDEDKDVREDLGEYQSEGGIAFPRHYGHVGADQKIELRYERIDVNKGIAPDVFAR